MLDHLTTWMKSSFDMILPSHPFLYLWCAFMVGFVAYYLYTAVKKPTLLCSDEQFKSFLVNNVPLISKTFWPTIWCFESRAQTILAEILRYNILPQINYRREILQLKDGGQVALDWLDPKLDSNCQSTTPVLIILPGLIGSRQNGYIKGLALASTRAGVRVVIFNYRGLGDLQLKTPRTYCATKTDDFDHVINSVKQKYPKAPVGCLGISMGGLILGQYMVQTEEKACNNLNAAMLISAPWNVVKGIDYVKSSNINLLFTQFLTSHMKYIIRRSWDVLKSGPWVLEDIMKSNLFWEFDERFTIKQFGYKDVYDYYHDSSLHNKLHRIHVPTLCINAEDDFLQPIEAIPLKEASENKNLAMLITSRGGHVGFMEGLLPFNKHQYLFRLCEQYFSSVFKNYLV